MFTVGKIFLLKLEKLLCCLTVGSSSTPVPAIHAVLLEIEKYNGVICFGELRCHSLIANHNLVVSKSLFSCTFTGLKIAIHTVQTQNQS